MNGKLSLLLIILWIVLISLLYLHTTNSFDQDLGRHIKLGEIIWQTKQVPKTNLFSYTNPNEPVFNSHWGSQVIFYFVNKSFGVNGLILLNTLINTLAFGLLFIFVSRRIGILTPSIVFIPFIFILTDRTWIRPEMFGNLFYAVLLITIFSKRIRNILKWFFPIIALLWINLHISWVFGVFVMAVVLLQDVVDSKYSNKAIINNITILAFMFVGLLLNPYGLEGVKSAFTILNKYGYTIVENQSFLFLRDFGFPLVSHVAFAMLTLVLSYSLLYIKKRKISFAEIVVVIVITILTLRFVRNETLFAYTAFAISCFNFSLIKPKRYTLAISLLALFVSAVIIVNINNKNGLPTGFGNKEKYEEGVAFFLSNNLQGLTLQGPIFNDFDIGGYLIYKVYPKTSIFVDNRPEAYPVSFFQEIYKPMQEDQQIFDKYAKEYSITTIIWSKHDSTPWSTVFLGRISKDENWEKAYSDDATIIYIKKRT